MSEPTNPYASLGISRNSDGSITRLGTIPYTPTDSNLSHSTPVLTKDISLNQSNKTFLRVFLPRRQALDSSSTTTKLPLIVYYHGGGFVVGAVNMTGFHDFCTTMADELPSVVVSVGYRLAPEHRLPAAYDDCVEALAYIKTTHEEWLTKFADFSNCYLMGSSAGGNIAYHAGLRAAVDHQDPLKIKGLILHQPYFGGTKRTQSELRLANDKIIPLHVNDFVAELALPIGADRDHEYLNPTVGGGSYVWGQIRQMGWKVLVSGCDGDPLIDRQIEFVKMLQEKGVQVVGKFGEGDYHGIEFLDPSKANALCQIIKHFMLS